MRPSSSVLLSMFGAMALLLAPTIAGAASISILEVEGAPFNVTTTLLPQTFAGAPPLIASNTPESVHIIGILVVANTGVTVPGANATAFMSPGTSQFFLAEPPGGPGSVLSDILSLTAGIISTTPCGTAFPGALCQTVDMTFTSDSDERGLGPTPTIGNPPTTPSSVITETDSPINLADPAVTSQANFFPLGSLNPFIVFSAATEPSATPVPEPMTATLVALGSVSLAVGRRWRRR